MKFPQLTPKHWLTGLCRPLLPGLTLILALLTGFSAQAAVKPCQNLLEQTSYYSTTPTAVHQRITTNFTKASKQQSVAIVDQVPGQHGGSRLVVRRTGAKWLAQYATFKFDVQGDPRWFIGAFGEDLARYFGFEIIDTKQMTIPDPVEFQNAIEKVNKELVAQSLEPIGISIVADDTSEAPLTQYLDHISESRLPFAAGGHHLVHDMSFHSGVIFTPTRFLEIARKRVRFVLDFVQFLKAQNDPSVQVTPEVVSYIKSFLVNGIDNGVGFGNLFLIAEQSDDPQVQTSIASLIQTMTQVRTDHDLNYSADELSTVPTAYLVLGSFGGYRHHRLSPVVYSVPSQKYESFTLETYTKDLIKQFLLAHERVKNYRLPSRKAAELAVTFSNSVDEQMELFKATPEGSEFDFDLTRTFSSQLDFSTPASVAMRALDASTDIQEEHLLRVKEIESAVRALQSEAH